MRKFWAIFLSVILVVSVLSIPVMADTYTITAMALDSTDFSEGAHYGGGRSLGVNQFVAWTITPEQSGTYEIYGKYGSDSTTAKLQIDDVDFKSISTTGAFGTHEEHSFGTFQMLNGFSYKFKIINCAGGKSMYLNSLILKKISDDAEIKFDLLWANRTTDKSAEHLRKNKTATWDVYIPEDGNYQIDWNGSTNKATGTHMTFTVNAQDNTVLGTAECKGNNVATDTVSTYGMLPLKEGETTITLKNISTLYDNAHNTVTIYPKKLTLKKVEEYDAVEAHTVTVNFSASDGQGYAHMDSTSTRYGVGNGLWERWNIDIPEDGEYDIYFYGGAQGSTETITDSLTYDIIVLGDKISGESPIIDPPKGTANAGWNRRVVTKVGNMKLKKGNNLMFFEVTSANTSTMDSSANLIHLVRTSNEPYVYKPTCSVKTEIFPYETGGLVKYHGSAIPSNIVPPYVELQLALVLYDDNTNIVDFNVQTLRYYENQDQSINLPKDVSEYTFKNAKLMVWEKDTMFPVVAAHLESGAELDN